MTIENAVRILAGSMSLVGLVIDCFVSPWGLLLVAFVGLNLVQSAFTGFCPASTVFARLGLADGTSGVSLRARRAFARPSTDELERP